MYSSTHISIYFNLNTDIHSFLYRQTYILFLRIQIQESILIELFYSYCSWYKPEMEICQEKISPAWTKIRLKGKVKNKSVRKRRKLSENWTILVTNICLVAFRGSWSKEKKLLRSFQFCSFKQENLKNQIKISNIRNIDVFLQKNHFVETWILKVMK